MSDVDTLKAEIKKLSARAITAKMNLHDLSEELPINWQSIMSTAEAARDAYKRVGRSPHEAEVARSRRVGDQDNDLLCDARRYGLGADLHHGH